MGGSRSAYAVQKEFSQSVSSYWSASAGSIYPAVARLKKRGLLISRMLSWGAKGRRAYSISAKGRRALRLWVEDVSPATCRPSMDPVRTRLNFLQVLPDTKTKLRFIARAIRHTSVNLVALRAVLTDGRTKSSFVSHFKTTSVIYELEARLRWLTEAKALISRDAVRTGRRRPRAAR